MNYLFVKEQCSYEDYASGRVLYNMPGTAPFPVRLGCEIFDRCVAALRKEVDSGMYTIYDPFCGGSYLFTSLGFLRNKYIKKIILSDISEEMISLAKRNLSLLTKAGINKRIMQIEELINQYGKDSHKGALESALKLRNTLEMSGNDIDVDCFNASSAELGAYRNRLSEVDIVITDLPYGRITNWSDVTEGKDAVSIFLESLYSVIPPHTVVAVISDKSQKVKHDLYRRIEHFNAGKRQVTLLKKVV